MFKKPTEIIIKADADGQRLDNYIIKVVKNVPKSRIYRAIRKGEVRINGGRCKQTSRLHAGDRLRLPPLHQQSSTKTSYSQSIIDDLLARILYEDRDYLVINKPAGMSVQGGSGERHSVIDILKHSNADYQHCYLVHRLDKPTSGCLLLAKTRQACAMLQEQWNTNSIDKVYWTVLAGAWEGGERLVDAPLRRHDASQGHKVMVDPAGKSAKTLFMPQQPKHPDYCIVHAQLLSGRLHQIRAHAAHIGQPILGDDKYGDFKLNRELRQQGITRLCLHALKLSFPQFETGQIQTVEAPVPADLLASVTSIFQITMR